MRQKSFDKAIEEAAAIREADLILKRPSSLAEFGFAFSPEILDRYTSHRKLLETSRNTVDIIAAAAPLSKTKEMRR